VSQQEGRHVLIAIPLGLAMALVVVVLHPMFKPAWR
jgi:hypothetical protein